MLDRVRRRRLPLPDSGIEIGLLDWGGDGPLALLHHANGFCAATWDLVARPLARHFRVIGMDARGHGVSSKPGGDEHYRWPLFGRDLAAVAAALAADHGRVALGMGHSFGGTSMVLAAAEHPDLFERLVLVDPVTPPAKAPPERRERVGGLIESARRRRAVFASRAEARERYAGKGFFAHWRPEALELYLAEGLHDRPDGQVELACAPATEAAVFAGGAHCDVWEVASRVSTPALVLSATRGDFPRALHERFAETLANARLELADAGHLIPMEQPEIVLREALAFAGVAQDSTG